LKLLFDQNISFKITRFTESTFPGCIHVTQVGLQDESDIRIFEFARSNGYTIVTFDSDFIDLCVVKGAPPKIIWLRTGNQTTKVLERILLVQKETIQQFLTQSDDAILEIFG
jgi:predicted nuclease of predicted toxin-antitoxin system